MLRVLALISISVVCLAGCQSVGGGASHWIREANAHLDFSKEPEHLLSPAAYEGSGTWEEKQFGWRDEGGAFRLSSGQYYPYATYDSAPDGICHFSGENPLW